MKETAALICLSALIMLDLSHLGRFDQTEAALMCQYYDYEPRAYLEKGRVYCETEFGAWQELTEIQIDRYTRNPVSTP